MAHGKTPTIVVVITYTPSQRNTKFQKIQLQQYVFIGEAEKTRSVICILQPIYYTTDFINPAIHSSPLDPIASIHHHTVELDAHPNTPPKTRKSRHERESKLATMKEIITT